MAVFSHKFQHEGLGAWGGGQFAMVLACLGVAAAWGVCQAASDASLPPGVKAVWDLGKAYREKTPTRERVCLNGLWRWQPATAAGGKVPEGRWGFFKVPGSWPGVGNYMQKESQTVYPHPGWKTVKLGGVTQAWYQRKITIPKEWKGRRIALSVEYLNSFATVYVDGKKVGKIRFPAGEADLTSACTPGRTHVLSLLVIALPLKGVMLSFGDTNAAKKVKGRVARRGLCGDVYLVGSPKQARIANVKVDPSVREWRITFRADLAGVAPGKEYRLRAEVLDQGQAVKTFRSKPFTAADLKAGRFSFTQPWKPAKLWDVHTPKNTYVVKLSLLEGGKAADTYFPLRFGFRELWIQGRDLYLNGTRIFLSAVPLDNAQVGAAQSTYAAAKESILRLRIFGINFVYTHNYGCTPGSHLSFEEILRAADDTGMLVALSQPHFGHYDWKAPDAEKKNGYAEHAAWYVRVAQNHPSVVFYATSHNATGDSWSMDPDFMGCDYAARVKKESPWSRRNRAKAARAEAIIRRLDPSRIVYHHSSGSFGVMHTVNFYTNWTPIQEMSDWLGHWAAKGVKPVFLCEYGVPFSWDWAMYRGWYPAEGPPKGKRTFGSAAVPWEFCLAEWNAQFFGDQAFKISKMEKQNLRWEAKKFRSGQLWHRWDYPHVLGSSDFPEREPVFAAYFGENWRAFRTWGLSANSPWEHRLLYKLRKGVNKGRKVFKTDWEHLQRPGFSPDFAGGSSYIERRYEQMELAYERKDWIATLGAKALIRNNRPLLAYLGGKPGAFTEKGHNFRPGGTVEKQLILINNSRRTLSAACTWSLGLPRALNGAGKATLATGEIRKLPLRFTLPKSLKPGAYKLTMKASFSNGEAQKDAFAVRVLPAAPPVKAGGRIALFDPKGETKKLLAGIGVQAAPVTAAADLSKYDLLIVGKGALSVNGAAPKIARVKDGLKVVMFEQSAEVLEKRFGFRVEEYGLRRVFTRVPDHPVLAGLDTESLRDWRGAATLLPPRLKSKRSRAQNYGFVFSWCGLPVRRVWRCGNRGNVASVLIEKPARGDFLPLVDGGFSLQYSPLMEYREGKGMVLFCQMDVTGRTENDPAAERLARNILSHAASWKPAPRRTVLYAGAAAGRTHLDAAGFSVEAYPGGALEAGRVLVVGPGGGQKLAVQKAALTAWLQKGGRLLAVGLDASEANTFLPFQVTMKKAEHIAAYFEPPGVNSPLAGLGPADVHNRDPRPIPLITGGAKALGDGVLAASADGRVIFYQLALWRFDHGKKKFNTRRTFRRSSCAVTRLLGNLGAGGKTPLLTRFSSPAKSSEKRWLSGFYLDVPVAWDDPYRFFGW